MFGSYARGGPDEYSDLDLIIVSDTERKFIKRADEFTGLYDVWGKASTSSVYTPDELSKMLAEGRYFIERALEEIIVIYEE